MDILDAETLDSVKEKGEYLKNGIEALGLPCLGKVGGMGLMLGIEVNAPYTNKELTAKLVENGLLALTAGAKIRLLPPLVITKEEMDEGLAIMKKTLEEL